VPLPRLIFDVMILALKLLVLLYATILFAVPVLLESTAMVMSAEPLYEVPVKPPEIVKVFKASNTGCDDVPADLITVFAAPGVIKAVVPAAD
jgi:hypothetical protein